MRVYCVTATMCTVLEQQCVLCYRNNMYCVTATMSKTHGLIILNNYTILNRNVFQGKSYTLEAYGFNGLPDMKTF
jgi:hypothetical protein